MEDMRVMIRPPRLVDDRKMGLDNRIRPGDVVSYMAKCARLRE
jgi:hypothetical protein